MAFDSFMMASSRLADPIADSAHPTLLYSKTRFGSIETSEALPYPGPNRPLDLWWLSEARSHSRKMLEAT